MNTGRQKTGITEPLPDTGFSDPPFLPPEDSDNPSGSRPGEADTAGYWEGDVE